MDIKSIEDQLVQLAVLCRKVMFKTTSGYEAEYASAIGREAQSTLLNLHTFSNPELTNIARNIANYTAEMNSIISA